jgi:hypothetical protein
VLKLPLEGLTVSEAPVAVLDSILEQSKQQQAPALPDDEFFESFASQNILRDFQVDPDDIDSGLVGTSLTNRKGSDGGIDGIYLFANGKIIRDLVDVEAARQNLNKNVLVDLVILQAS